MTDVPDQQSPPREPRRPGQGHPRVVVIAGADVAAMERLAPELPIERGMAFIFALAPTPSPPPLRADRVQRLTPLHVAEARDGLRLEPDHLYLVPRGELVTISDDGLALSRRDPGTLPLDHLFRSLALHDAEHSAAILLSGLRGDGSIGAAEMKASGALVILQAAADEAEASSPERQLLAKRADLVLPLPRIMKALVDYFQPACENGETGWPAPFDHETLAPILGALGESTGHDFTRYKRSILGRRIQRRMRVHGSREPGHYLKLLEARPAEADLVFNEMLMGGTRFFRDPGAYPALERAIDEYLQRLPPQQDVRVWVPACASGEEAYSLAIVLHECAQRANKKHAVKLFATDVDARTIELARAGRYPLGIAAYVSQQRLERYFVREEDAYRVKEETREGIIFAPHDITRDPPFTHIDLISCRNLLSYLEPELQKHVLTLFEYALEPGGLLLGGAESVGALQNAFESVNKSAKLFKHRATHARRSFALPLDPLGGERYQRRDDRFVTRPGARPAAVSAAEQLLLGEFVPPSAVIAPSGELTYLHGRTGRFLEPPVGEPSTNLFDMAREGLRLELPAAVRAAHRSQQMVVRRGLNVRTNGSMESVTVTVKPLEQPETLRGLLLVTFAIEDRAVERAPAAQKEPSGNREADLHHMHTTLQGMIEELEASNEALESMNEELRSTNAAAVQSSYEAAARREEPKALDETLQALSEELVQRDGMLSRSSDDLRDLLSSLLPYRTANDVIDGLISTVTGIQRLKGAQRQREEGRRLFEDVMGSLPLPLVLLDESFKLHAVSLEFARRFGATVPDSIGKPLGSLGSGWRLPTVAERLETLARGEPCPPFRLHGHLGGPCPVEVVVHPRRLRDEHPAARYLFLIQEANAPLPADINAG